MRAFVITDSSKRKARPVAVLAWSSDDSEEQGRFSLQVSTACDEESLPLSISFCVNRADRTATPEESREWVRSRIVPENRQNIAEVLAANGLADYSEVDLFAACKGRSSDDDLLAYEVDLPTSFGTDSPEGGLRADRIIDAIKRQRRGPEIRYAFVDLRENGDDDGRDGQALGTGDPTAAQQIGKIIRSMRREQGLTQKQLAARAGITQTVLSRVESGKGNPTLSLLEEIAAALGAELDISLK